MHGAIRRANPLQNTWNAIFCNSPIIGVILTQNIIIFEDFDVAVVCLKIKIDMQ